jgi:glycosyltransferase involved in cell wall biosynthesis
MKIDHIFHNLNTFGGAEEHITSLSSLQKAQGNDVSLCLVQAVTQDNQYAQRLKLAGVSICQWPVLMSRVSGDWDTREEILRFFIGLLGPLINIVVFFINLFSDRSQQLKHESAEGRLRSFFGRLLDPNRERRLFLLLLTCRFYLHRPDVLHIHSYGAGMEFVLQWAQAHNLPAVYQEHSTPDTTKRRWYKLPIDLNMARIIVAVSEASADALRLLCGVTRPIQVIHPIVAVTIPEENIKEPSKFDGSKVHVLTIARLSIEKGLDYLVKAAERVVEVNPNVQFIIYGEGYLRESLEEQINTAHLGGQISLEGNFSRNELPTIMSAAEIFVLPSITEGFPLSVLEAMAWGLPIIATSVGGVPELIENGVTGMLCPPRNEDALAHAIITLINSPIQCALLGDAAKKTYNQKFKSEYIAAQFADVYAMALDTTD